MRSKPEPLYLVSLHSSRPNATISDRGPTRVAFARGRDWWEGDLSVDELFRLLKPALKHRRDER